MNRGELALVLLPFLWTHLGTCSSCTSVLINEVNADNPGSTDTMEYIELWNTGNCPVTLDGCHVALYNGASAPPALYEDLDLNNYCISGNGYFLIGPSSLSIPADYLLNYPSFIQNGNGVADSVTLYTSQFNGAPAAMTSGNLVDALVHDRQLDTVTSSFMPGILPLQNAVFENSDYLEDDESMSRCSPSPLNMTVFSASYLTPRAPNMCQPEVIVRWPSPCPNTVFADAGRPRSFQYRTTRDVKAANPIQSLKIHSLIECSTVCSRTDGCTHFSYYKDAEKTGPMDNCLLHDYCRTMDSQSPGWIVGEKFYKMSAKNPVWPHGVPI